MPSMRSVSTIRPAIPGGRLSGVEPPARALLSSVSNGSRRVTAFSPAGFSAWGFAEFAGAACAGSWAVAAGFAGAGAGGFGALGAGEPAGAGFINCWRTAFGWTFGWSCAQAQVARTADRVSGRRFRNDFASRIVSRLNSAYLRTG